MGLCVIEDVQYIQVPCFLIELRTSGVSRCTHMKCTMWNLDICHVYSVKLLHSCCLLHPQDRVQTNKMFHTCPVLTVHQLLRRSYTVSLSPTHRKKHEASVQIIQGQEALGTNNCLIPAKPPKLKSITSHCRVTGNCMFFSCRTGEMKGGSP